MTKRETWEDMLARHEREKDALQAALAEDAAKAARKATEAHIAREAKPEYRAGTTPDRVLAMLDANPRGMTSAEMFAALEAQKAAPSRKSLSVILSGMKKRQVVSWVHGLYRLPRHEPIIRGHAWPYENYLTYADETP